MRKNKTLDSELGPERYYIDPKTGKKKKSVLSLSDESFKALVELGEVLRGIHERMVDEGYEIKDGKVVKKQS